jgi:hypothetical protein
VAVDVWRVVCQLSRVKRHLLYSIGTYGNMYAMYVSSYVHGKPYCTSLTVVRCSIPYGQDLISFEFEQESNTKLQKYSSATNDDRLVSSRLVSLSLSLTVCLSYLPVANDRTTRKNPSDTNTTLMIGT